MNSDENLHCASPEIKTLAYITLVRSITEYAKIVWNPCMQTNRLKREKSSVSIASRFIVHHGSDAYFSFISFKCIFSCLDMFSKSYQLDQIVFFFFCFSSNVVQHLQPTSFTLVCCCCLLCLLP